MSIIDHKSCLLEDSQFEVIATERTFCGKAEGEGPCLGDSGSGFYVEHDRIWFLEGITSSSLVRNGDCDVTKNAVFTSISKFTDWIHENTGSTMTTQKTTTKPVVQNELNLQSNLVHDHKRVQLTTDKTVMQAPSSGDVIKVVTDFAKWFGWRPERVAFIAQPINF